MWYKSILIVLFMFAMVSISSASTWGALDHNYAIVPGKSIGKLNLGMPLKDANVIAQKIYGSSHDGSNVELNGFTCYGDAEEICLAADNNGKVSHIIAQRNSEYYVVVPNIDPDNYPHLLSANLENMVDALGDPTDQAAMDPYLGLRWDNLGTIAIFQTDQAHSITMLWAVGIYSTQ